MLCSLHVLSIGRAACSIRRMVRRQLRDEQWSRVERVLLAQRRTGRRGRDDRNFIEAVLWWRRTGVPWRELPGEFGSWKTVFNRFDRWSKDGRWAQLFEALRVDPDDEWHSLDSTINRAHQHAAGAKGGAQRTESGARAGVRRPRCTSSSMRSGSR